LAATRGRTFATFDAPIVRVRGFGHRAESLLPETRHPSSLAWWVTCVGGRKALSLPGFPFPALACRRAPRDRAGTEDIVVGPVGWPLHAGAVNGQAG